ncbi:UNVERIFIED_CONTAM: hypothetical protein K2H54_073641 [Gekko kuhli]
MMKLACGDIRFNIIYGLVVIIFAIGVDLLLIFFSYFFILKAALSLTHKARLKALGTCISHICAVFLFYVPLIGVAMVHRFSKTHGSHVHVIMANVHLLMPPVLNPLVYGVKTKQIRHRIGRAFGQEVPDSFSAKMRGLGASQNGNRYVETLPGTRVSWNDMMKLACGDIKFNIIYGLVVIIFAIGVDSLLISFSYFFILKAALSLTHEARLKALGTCVSHICVVFLFYVPFIGLSMVHRFNKTHGSHVHIIMANVHLLVPPVLNPLVYGVKTKQIRHRIGRAFDRVTH